MSFPVVVTEMEQQCDVKYGTKFASTPESAQKDLEELEQKLCAQQSDLRSLERLGHVVSVEPREKIVRHMPGPLPIPNTGFGLSSEASVKATGSSRAALPVKIRLNGKAKKPATKRTTGKKSKEGGSKLNAPAANIAAGIP